MMSPKLKPQILNLKLSPFIFTIQFIPVFILIIITTSIHNTCKYNFLTEVEAAHARKRPTTTSSSSTKNHNNIHKYDRQITTFDPNGKLLQVEYAHECTKRGQSCAFVNYNDDMIIAVMKRKKIHYDQDDGDGGFDYEELKRKSESNKEKDESVRLSFQNNRFKSTYTCSTSISTSTGIHRISDGILCKMTGLEGDGRLLARHLQSAAHQLAWTDGIISSSSSSSSSSRNIPVPVVNVNQIAKLCGQVQHSLTIRSGARPLGVDAVFMGRKVINNIIENKNNNGCLGLFQCTVGGTVHECNFCASGKDSNLILDQLNEFVNRNKEDWDSNGNNNCFILKQIIEQVSRIVIQPDERNRSDANSNDRVDIYVIMANSKCRGGIQISCALSVLERDVEHVANMFQQEYFPRNITK